MAVVGAACSPPPGAVPELRTARVVVPAMPLPPVGSIVVDGPTIDAAVCAGCHDATRFFGGQLAMSALDELAQVPPPPIARQRQLLGSLLVSGYFGGIDLRTALGGSVTARELSPLAPSLELVGRATIEQLDSLADTLLKASHGDAASVVLASNLLAPAMARLAGYDRGYLQVALAHPPAGATSAADRLVCTGLFECRVTAFPLPALDRLASARWAVTSDLQDIGNRVLGAQDDVWGRVVGAAALTPDAYDAVIDLAGGFLQGVEAALLGSAAGRLGDVATGQAGLSMTTGVLVWAGSWFLGLTSPLPDGTAPSLL
jgi:hypothetical protein